MGHHDQLMILLRNRAYRKTKSSKWGLLNWAARAGGRGGPCGSVGCVRSVGGSVGEWGKLHLKIPQMFLRRVVELQ